MNSPFYQGYLDSLCGVYSIVNAHKLVTRASALESQNAFNDIISYLAKKKKLKSTLIDGVNHKIMCSIIYDVMGERFSSIETNKKSLATLNEWWTYSKAFLDENERATIILSLAGKVYHLTAVREMSDKSIVTYDSSDGTVRISKRNCRIAGYTKEDKYLVFPSQCFYLS